MTCTAFRAETFAVSPFAQTPAERLEWYPHVAKCPLCDEWFEQHCANDMQAIEPDIEAVIDAEVRRMVAEDFRCLVERS